MILGEGVLVNGGGTSLGVGVFDPGIAVTPRLPKLKPSGLGLSAGGKLDSVEAGGLVARDAEDAGVPKRPPLAGVDEKKPGFAGAGVETGVVESVFGGSSGLLTSSVESISVSLDTGASAADVLAASPRAVPKPPPKNEALDSPEGSGASSLAEGSALKVEPRTKLLELNGFADLLSVLFRVVEPKAGSADPVLNGEVVLGAPKGLGAGFAPKMLPPLGAAAEAAAKPPPVANPANPSDDDAVFPVLGAELPNTEVGLLNPLG